MEHELKKILVTGGAGFIGSHLVPRLLALGCEVRILDNLSPQVHGAQPAGLEWLKGDGIEFMRGDVTNRADWERALAGVDAVYHLAAETGTGQSMYQVSHYTNVNVLGTAHLFDVLANGAGHSVRRVMLASSRSVYGEGAYQCRSCADGRRHCPPSRPRAQLEQQQWEPACPACAAPMVALATEESDSVRPGSVYAASKYAQEDLVRVGCESLGIGYAILRLQNVYGEGQSLKNPYTGILSIFSTRLRRGLPLPLFEDGLESRDFVHVSDVVEAFVRCLSRDNAADAVINVGSGKPTTVAEVATALASALGVDGQVEVTGEFRLGDIRHNFASVTRLREVLGFSPQLDLAQGLQRFCRWVHAQELPPDQLEKANAELRARKLMS